MTSKEILVVTTSTIQPLEIKKYIKPISAHIVVGVNFFSDFLGSLTDVFGGKSATYQKKLSSLYDEAIIVLKNRAKECGANCVLGLSIDVDEIAGKGKSMFMITATGTAVIVESQKLSNDSENEKTNDILSQDFIRQKIEEQKLLEKAKAEELVYDEAVWDFIISNKMEGMLPYIIKRYSDVISNKASLPEVFAKFDANLESFLANLNEESRCTLVYQILNSSYSHQIKNYFVTVINKLSLYSFEYVRDLLKHEDFKMQKIALRIAICDKPYYSYNDLEELKMLKSLIDSTFKARGELTTKKLLLTTKEKEVWNCECGNKNNEIGDYCSSCNLDIYGFLRTDVKPVDASSLIEEKISVIRTYLGGISI
jgi:uncharacterized protein YbjQ (UPF0145 family)